MTYRIATKTDDTFAWHLWQDSWDSEEEALEVFARAAFAHGSVDVRLLVEVPTLIEVTAKIHPGCGQSWGSTKEMVQRGAFASYSSKSTSAVFCDHANESPEGGTCKCPYHCYCRVHGNCPKRPTTEADVYPTQ